MMPNESFDGGRVVISVDIALGVGVYGRDNTSKRRIYRALEGWRELLSVLNQYRLPATWAVVGRLFHSNHDRGLASHSTLDDWLDYGHDRDGGLARRPARTASGLLREIASSSLDHEVASHTFSSVPFSEPWVDRELATAELVASIEAASELPCALTSITFPRDSVGHLETLFDWGFICYRGRPAHPSTDVSLGDERPEPPLSEPYIDEYGLVNVPGSMSLCEPVPAERRAEADAWIDPAVQRIRRGIDRAAREDGVFHLTVRPRDVVTNYDIRRVESVCSYLDVRRRETGLDVVTMNDTACAVLSKNRSEPSLRSHASPKSDT